MSFVYISSELKNADVLTEPISEEALDNSIEHTELGGEEAGEEESENSVTGSL